MASATVKKQLIAKVLLGVIIFFVPLLICISFEQERVVSFMPETEVVGIVPPINDEQIIQQVFTPSTSTISEVAVQVGTYVRTNDFILRMEIAQVGSETVLASCDVDASKFMDNDFEKIEFKRLRVDPEKQYIITFYSDGANDTNTVSFYRTGDFTSNEQNYACINGERQTYSLNLAVYGNDATLSLLPWLCMIFLLAGASTVVWIAGRTRRKITDRSGNSIISARNINNFFYIPKEIDEEYSISAMLLLTNCLVLTLALVGMVVYTYVTGVYPEFYSSRLVFYLLVISLAIFIYLMVSKSPKIIYLLIIGLGVVWIICDREYNIIDEGSHMYIINYIVDNHRFPLIQENYEAVQGPVYYYLMAILFGLIPQEIRYFACRLAGLGCLIIFGFVNRLLIKKLVQCGLILVDLPLQNIIWFLFMLNPHILIRLTRVSNESLAVLLSGIIIYLVVNQLLDGADRKITYLVTILCAINFLTKATTIFLFVGVIIVNVYYKHWRDIAVNIFLLLVLICPWFISNYITYGELTAMSGHLEFVLPIVNPEKIPVDIFSTILSFFDNYFFAIEAGYWFYYPQLSAFLSSLCLFLFCTATFIAGKALVIFFADHLRFRYDILEKEKIIVITLVALPLASMVMHSVTSAVTYVNSLGCNRYFLILNGVFCCLLLMGLSNVKLNAQKYIAGMASFVLSVLTTSMIFGYLNIILQQ